MECRFVWLREMCYEQNEENISRSFRNAVLEINKKINWTEKVTNEDILTPVEETKSILNVIK